MKLQHTRPSGDGQIANAIKKLQREVEGLRASQAPNALLSRTTRGTAVRPNAGPSNISNTHVVARWL
jgi:hypothetical protein